MKKAMFILMFFIVTVFSLNAKVKYQFACYKGFAGIPLANDTYKGGSNWSRDDKGNSENTNLVGTYDDTEMVALMAVSGNTDQSSSVTISVSAPNGLYLVSQSNPTAKRPFEINAYCVKEKDGKTVQANLSNDNPTDIIDVSKNDSFHFDIVIVLPGELDTTTNRLKMVENGVVNYYPLVVADDYSATVTITLSVNGQTSDPFVIPFSGYYDGNLKGKNTSTELPVSLSIETYPEATNINIINDKGTWIPVGSLSFLLRLGSYVGDGAQDTFDPKKTGFWTNEDNSVPGENNTTIKNLKCAIMLSSSPDPFTSRGLFTMKKDGLSYNDALTTYNSINFDVRLIDKKDDNIVTFDGSDFITSSDNLPNTQAEWEKQRTKFAIPRLRQPIEFFEHQGRSIISKAYNGELQVRVHDTRVNMDSGRYTGEIYIHVLIQE